MQNLSRVYFVTLFEYNLRRVTIIKNNKRARALKLQNKISRPIFLGLSDIDACKFLPGCRHKMKHEFNPPPNIFTSNEQCCASMKEGPLPRFLRVITQIVTAVFTSLTHLSWRVTDQMQQFVKAIVERMQKALNEGGTHGG